MSCSFDIYLKALTQEEDEAPVAQKKELLRIGQLGKHTGESNATLRFWTKEGLLEVAETTEAGYQLYHPSMAERVKEIRRLQGERFTLKEIKAKISE
ncbi:MAG: MerR family transcriptional regulator [Opitutales bacterium]